ncbi:MAG: prepilin-type N-terminal cleavage/methylation domain-containing protein [Bacillota bacterium]|nr:prepilin-type N-terminal cleavage/methylation domain-containing protein [Bacillota bacterium]
MRILIRSKFGKIMGPSRGVTLPEILVSVSIFSIIVIPFLATFLSATENNVSSKDKLNTSVLSERLMDDIKARPLFLASKAGVGNFLYSSDSGYEVYCNIEEVYRGALPTSSAKYEFNLDTVNSCQEFLINEDTVDVDGSNFNLLNGTDTEIFNLKIKKNAGSYFNEFYKGGNLQSTEQIFPEDKINEKINFAKNGSDKFELHVTVDSTVDKEVSFYIIDDSNRLILVNDGDKSFNQYFNASSKEAPYSDVLYKIEISVFKGSDSINKLVSYVNKQ